MIVTAYSSMVAEGKADRHALALALLPDPINVSATNNCDFIG